MDDRQIPALNVNSNQKHKKGSGKRPKSLYFPRLSLKEALRIPETIWNHNNGKPSALGDLATYLNYSPMSRSFKELVRSSERYGLTEGSWTQNTTRRVSLSDLGSSIVAPKIGAENIESFLFQALLRPNIFKRFLESIDGKAIPSKDVFTTTLIKDHYLSKEDAETCYKVLIKNISDYNLFTESGNKKFLRLDKLIYDAQSEDSEQTEQEEMEDNEDEEEQQYEDTKSQNVDFTEKLKPKVFISHSKNTRILEQIKQMLSFGDFEYEVAEEVETTSIPIPEKIFGLMRKCNCAVINISADEQEKNDEGYHVNQNVLIEIGAAFLAYDKRVILLVDKRLKLPSNLQGLYLSYYEGDELSWDTGMKLQKALTDFRKLF